MDPDAGWQSRLCATLCAPPLPRLRFLQRTPFIAQQLSGLEREAWICFVLGFLRSTLNSSALLGDFMGGGTDLFAALLAILGIYDVCAMNGSLLIMFLVWAVANVVLFNLLFSFAPNMIHASVMLSSGQSVAFVADNLLLLFNSGIQALPDWRNQMTGTGSGEPLLQAERAAPRAARTGPSFQPFAGSGQRLGAAG
ncbi:unnamed protein product [Effrenium voratum]|uniref:Uncharacterized protein n=1 Tax=Effrenium voratum TaxID=2562239 RepID=A0AA36N0W5_9DINO|nr:unnamed protein product [Effrenium voratum]